jgi:hypothetical protein
MYLADYQERELSTQPDLIAQLGARIARDYELRYGGPVQVRAEALVSLNGRRAQLLVDPTVDIADGAPDLDRWILPEPSEPPLGARSRKLAVR